MMKYALTPEKIPFTLEDKRLTKWFASLYNDRFQCIVCEDERNAVVLSQEYSGEYSFQHEGTPGKTCQPGKYIRRTAAYLVYDALRIVPTKPYPLHLRSKCHTNYVPDSATCPNHNGKILWLNNNLNGVEFNVQSLPGIETLDLVVLSSTVGATLLNFAPLTVDQFSNINVPLFLLDPHLVPIQDFRLGISAEAVLEVYNLDVKWISMCDCCVIKTRNG